LPVELPRTEAELATIVKQAAGRADVTIALSAYGRLLRVDRDEGVATAEAGISLRDLSIALGSWGLSMENGGGRPAQELGAAVSLGSHATGASYGILATQVAALRLVTPSGTVVSCSAEEEPDLFDTARVGFGALGVISTVTVRCQPGFNLRVRSRTLDLDRAIVEFDAWADGNDHFQLSWRPGRSRARAVTANRTEEPADGAAVDRGYRWFNRRQRRHSPVEFSYPRSDAASALDEARARAAAGVHRWAPPSLVVVSVTAGDDLPLSPTQGRSSVFIAGVAGLDGRPPWAASQRAWYPRTDEWEAARDRLDPDRRFSQSSGQG
jgi:hypothetical protein